MKMLKESLKKVLPRDSIDNLKGLQKKLSMGWIRALSRSATLRRFHYSFFSSAFDREAYAVVVGHLQHEENLSGAEPVNYFLRRAVHRIEKGLIMQPRREVFALDYIGDTVDSYIASLNGNVDRDEVSWAHDVLAEYFTVTGEHPVINRAREKFARLERPVSSPGSLRNPDTERVPFAADVSTPSVDYTAMRKLSMKRRSVRWYQDRPVPREVIDKAVEVAVQSPSACNRQPYRFLIFDDAASVAQASRLPMGVAGFDHNFPAIVAVVGRLRAYPHVRDRHVIYIDGALAAMSFMFALETQGVSSCSINWPDIPEREQAAAKLLKLDPDERIVMFISLGYAADTGLVPYSQKLSLDEARSYGHLETSSR
ncbi:MULTISPECIES: nitroreductase family protein [Pseudomonas]|nr:MULTISPECIES: nitroreductase family protein [Pseudomonas]